MKLPLGLIPAAFAVLASGCATVQQLPIALAQNSIATQAGRIGVVMTALPKADTYLPGASCVHCMAVVSRMNSELMAHAATLTFEDFPKLRIELSSLLRKNGAAVTLIEKDLDLKALPDFSAEGPNIAIKDFSSLQRKHQIDKLLVINITMIGFERTYSAYTPTSPPKGVFQGLGYIVNLKTNSYDWYLPVRVIKSSEMTWDEPPNFPGLTNAYFQSLEIGKDQFLQPFADSVKTREKVAVAPPSPVTANMMPTPVMSTTKTTQ